VVVLFLPSTTSVLATMPTSFPTWLDIQSSTITSYSQLYQTHQLMCNRSLLMETVASWSQLGLPDHLCNRACAQSKRPVIEMLLLRREHSKTQCEALASHCPICRNPKMSQSQLRGDSFHGFDAQAHELFQFQSDLLAFSHLLPVNSGSKAFFAKALPHRFTCQPA